MIEITTNFSTNHNAYDFIIGLYYYITDVRYKNEFVLVKCSGYKDRERIIGSFISTLGGNTTFRHQKEGNAAFYITGRHIRLATMEEVLHLESCINQNKFIPLEGNIIPEKWCIKITNDNAKELSQFLKEKCHEYIGYVESWDPQSAINFYMVYPQIEKHTYSYQKILSKYNCKEITTEFFREHILKKNNINKLKEFPSEGCCESIDINFERYFRNKYGASSYSTSGIRKGISWNSGGWWFVSNIKSCIRKEYKIEELEHFFKKENKEELINKLTTNKKEENYEHTSKNESIKVCRPDFKVSEGLRKRGIGIKSTGVKILIGNRYCNN